jgi:hypothetical protein
MRSFLTRTLALSLMGTAAIAPSAYSFDLEDYATTYRATRDAYLKAYDEVQLAVGVFARARLAAGLAGFNVTASEQYFWPLDNFRPKVSDRTGVTCVDTNGNGSDEMCNIGATCGSDGKCTAPSGPQAVYGPGTDWKTIITGYVQYLSAKDTITRLDNGLDENTWTYYPTVEGLLRIEGDNPFGSYNFWGMVHRAYHQYRETIQQAAPDIFPQPEGSPFAGMYVASGWQSAQWQLDPEDPVDQEILEIIAMHYYWTRESLLRSVSDLKMATGPYRAAQAAYDTATEFYLRSTSCTPFDERGIQPEWFCIASANGSLRCDCNAGTGRCPQNNAVIANEEIPAQSVELCPATPSADLPCLCVQDAAGTPCVSGTGTRTYE